jgi:DNA polymerase III delta prime subunit
MGFSSSNVHVLCWSTCAAGKTSTALAIARQLYGPELMKTRVMELNASDERGINVVRQKVSPSDSQRQRLRFATPAGRATEQAEEQHMV